MVAEEIEGGRGAAGCDLEACGLPDGFTAALLLADVLDAGLYAPEEWISLLIGILLDQPGGSRWRRRQARRAAKWGV
jgi:hypothetical protein